MTDTTQGTAVRLDIEVAAPQESAFWLFVREFDRIKPHEHNLLSVDIAETIFESRVGGRIYDRGVDGSVCEWAEVLAFEPTDRFVIGWRISPQWTLETDPQRISEVEVTFTELGAARTRVDLVHSKLERHGAGWEDARSALESGDGWPLYVRRYEGVVASA